MKGRTGDQRAVYVACAAPDAALEGFNRLMALPNKPLLILLEEAGTAELGYPNAGAAPDADETGSPWLKGGMVVVVVLEDKTRCWEMAGGGRARKEDCRRLPPSGLQLRLSAGAGPVKVELSLFVCAPLATAPVPSSPARRDAEDEAPSTCGGGGGALLPCSQKLELIVKFDEATIE